MDKLTSDAINFAIHTLEEKIDELDMFLETRDYSKGQADNLRRKLQRMRDKRDAFKTINTETEKMETSEGYKYELYRGKIWITPQDFSEHSQGMNISYIDPYGGMRVIAYVVRQGSRHDNNIESEVQKWLVAHGWTDKYIQELLGASE